MPQFFRFAVYLCCCYCLPLACAMVFDARGSRLMAQTATIVEVFDTDNSPLPDNRINALAIQPDGTLWMGTDGGAVQLAGGQWQVYTTADSGLPDDWVRSIAVKGNNIFMGTFVGGLAIYDETTWKSYNTNTSDLADNNVKCIAFNNTQQSVWLGTTGGISVWHPADDSWTTYFSISPDLSLNNISLIAFDAANTAWIATINAGLIAFDGEGFFSYKTSNSGIPDNSINKVLVAPNADKWLTTLFHGLVRFGADETWQVFNTSNSPLTTNQLTALWLDNNGNLLIGSYDDGLFIANIANNTWLHLNTNNSLLPDNRITDLIAESDSSVWVATYNGGLARLLYSGFPTVATTPTTPKPLGSLQVYPNPVVSGGTLQFSFDPPSTAIQLAFTENMQQSKAMLYNAQGMVVAQWSSLPINTDLVLPLLPTGYYRLRVLLGQQGFDTPIVVVEKK